MSQPASVNGPPRCQPPSRVLAVLVLLLAPCMLARAGTLTGTVTGETGAPVAGARLEILAADGRPATTGFIVSDSEGHYVVDLPEAPYDLIVHAPAGGSWATREIQNVVIVGSIYRHVTMLPTAATVSGTITDASGAPVARVIPQFRDAQTGEAWLTLGAGSDLAGRYSARVPLGTWDVRFLPAADMTGVGAATIQALSVAGDVARDAQLPSAVPVAVRVLDAAGAPLVAVAVDATDAFAAGFGSQRSETTDAQGRATLWLPLGDYHFGIRPAQDVPSVAATLRDVKITGAATLPDVRLQSGVIVPGRVRDGGNGRAVARADVRFAGLAQGQPVASAALTNASGFFTAAVPAGTWTLDIVPAVGSRVARGFFDGFVASGGSAPFIDAEPAWLLEGLARGAGGAALAATELRIVNASSGLPVRANAFATDRFGVFQVSLPFGQYHVDLVPRVESGFAGLRVRQDIQGGDIRMLPTTLPAGHLVTGRFVSASGAPVQGMRLVATDPATGDVRPLGGDVSDAFGEFATRLPTGTWHVEAIAPAPHLGTAFDVTLSADAALGDLSVGTGFSLSGQVVDDAGLPVRDVTASFVDPASGLVIAQPVITDGSGRFSRGVVAGPAQLRLNPAPGSPLQAATRTLTISGATDAGVIRLGVGDLDGDGFGDLVDACPVTADPLQRDRDADGVGDACDNCRILPDASQADADSDGIGNPCEFEWGDIAPVAAPDGRIDVADVVVALRMSVGLEPINAQQAVRGNVAPADFSPASPAPLATPNLSVPGVIDVGDVVLLLRASVTALIFPQPR